MSLSDAPERLILISGRSGSGKSAALNTLEDAGFCCVDNLPAEFLPDLATMQHSSSGTRGLAVAVDVRTPSTDLERIPDLLQSVPSQRWQIIFLDASTEELVKRFSETRRKHPLTSNEVTLAEALARESGLLSEISEVSDLTINTDQLTHYELQQLLRTQLSLESTVTQQLVIQSFGFKYGVPSSADYLFDVRCLSNPHWIPELRPLTGKDQAVIDYLANQNEVAAMQASIQVYLDQWIPRIFSGNRSYLTVAIGCTGGKHRSVFLAEKLYEYFHRRYENVLVRHRDLQ